MRRLVRAYQLTFCIGLRLLILGAVAVGGLGLVRLWLLLWRME